MTRIAVKDEAGAFAEDKDIAANLRDHELRPRLVKRKRVQLDFTGVEGATQSFVHALISEPIRALGASVLDLVEFKGCNPTVRSVIEIVVDYSQLTDEGETGQPAASANDGPPKKRRRA